MLPVRLCSGQVDVSLIASTTLFVDEVSTCTPNVGFQVDHVWLTKVVMISNVTFQGGLLVHITRFSRRLRLSSTIRRRYLCTPPAVPITASGLQGPGPLVNRSKQRQEIGKLDFNLEEKDWSAT